DRQGTPRPGVGDPPPAGRPERARPRAPIRRSDWRSARLRVPPPPDPRPGARWPTTTAHAPRPLRDRDSPATSHGAVLPDLLLGQAGAPQPLEAGRGEDAIEG